MLSRYNIFLPSLSPSIAECSFFKHIYSHSIKKIEDLEINLVYKNLKPYFILHGPPKCLFKCPQESIFVVVLFFYLGLKLTETNSDCPSFGALAFLSCYSSGSQIFFLANRIIIQHQFFLYSSLPGKELQNFEKMYSRLQLWRLQHSRCWYLLYWFSTLKVSLAVTINLLVVGLCLEVDMAYIRACLIHLHLFA